MKIVTKVDEELCRTWFYTDREREAQTTGEEERVERRKRDDRIKVGFKDQKQQLQPR